MRGLSTSGVAFERRAVLAAIGFLTRVPVSADLDGADVARAAAYFPLVGAGVGAVAGAVVRALGPSAGLVVSAGLTGALHLDALADTADALGTRDPERALAIMRDSRIGSFGATAIGLDLLVRAEALARIDRPVAAWAAAAGIARVVPVLLGAALPYARPAGTGAVMASTPPARVALAGLGAAALGVMGGSGLSSLWVAGAVGTATGWFWRRRIGGVTGDVLGASLELTETALLVLWSRP